jgi:electron transport complex protein RnfD
MRRSVSAASQPNEKSLMTKNTLMKYTLVALVILVGVSALSWWPTSIILAVIAVTVAIGLDYALSLVMRTKGSLNTLSAAVFGLIVALSYSLSSPSSYIMSTYLTSYYMPELLPLEAPMAFVYVAIIAAVGMVLFKKLQGLLGRKYVNAAAAAKLLVFLPFLPSVLFPAAHATSISLVGPIGYHIDVNSTNPVFGAFAGEVQGCMGKISSRAGIFNVTPAEVFQTLALLKFHGWVGGASAVAVILVGVSLFAVAHKYIKWRITLSYLLTIVAMSTIMFGIYGGDLFLRMGFELFIGSSIFLAFFMATDPETTPQKYIGQGVFGVGLGVLTVLIQMYMGFLGGSILALVIMNLTSPLLDKIGKQKTLTTTVLQV